MRKLKIIAIATLTVLPLLGIFATILLEKQGCYGGTANIGADEPFCMIKGFDLGRLYEAVGSIAFFAIILAPLTLIWTLGGIYACVRYKRKTA